MIQLIIAIDPQTERMTLQCNAGGVAGKAMTLLALERAKQIILGGPEKKGPQIEVANEMPPEPAGT